MFIVVVKNCEINDALRELVVVIRTSMITVATTSSYFINWSRRVNQSD